VAQALLPAAPGLIPALVLISYEMSGTTHQETPIFYQVD